MADEVTAERVRIMAASARVPLDWASAERVAGAVSATVKRFGEEKTTLPLEIEPATFAVVARQAVERD
jgi:hypothetical protein